MLCSFRNSVSLSIWLFFLENNCFVVFGYSYLSEEPSSVLSQNQLLPKKVFIFEDLSILSSERPWGLVPSRQAALDVKPLLQGGLREEYGVHDEKEDGLAANLDIVDAKNFDN